MFTVCPSLATLMEITEYPIILNHPVAVELYEKFKDYAYYSCNSKKKLDILDDAECHYKNELSSGDIKIIYTIFERKYHYEYPFANTLDTYGLLQSNNN